MRDSGGMTSAVRFTGRVDPDIVELQHPGRFVVMGVGGRFMNPGLLPGCRRKRVPLGQAATRSAAGTDHFAAILFIKSQVGFVQVRFALTPVRITDTGMREPVPGNVRQIALLVDQNPGYLLQPAAARPALKTLATIVVVLAAPPRRPVQQAALQAAGPEREAADRYPIAQLPVVEPLRDGRSTKRLVDAQSVADLVHVADLPFQRVVAGFVPVPNIRHDHQMVGVTHDGAHRTVAQEVRQAHGDISFLDGRPVCRNFSTH